MMPQNRFASFTGTYVFYAFYITCLFLLVKGYQFNTGDQAEHLPLVYKMMDSSLYPYDYFVSASHGIFTIRFYFVWTIYLLSWIAPVSTVCLVLTFVSIWLTAYSFIRITYHFSSSTLAPYLSPVLIFFIFYDFTIGGNHLQYSILICSTLAKGISAYSLLLFLRKKYIISFLLTGIAALYQPLVGSQLFILLTIAMLFDYREVSPKIFIYSIVAFLLPASFMIGPVLYRQFSITGSYDPALYYNILYRFRNPHHYLPSLFPVSDYIKFTLVTAGGIIFAYIGKFYERAFILRFFVPVLAGMILYWLAVEKLDLGFIGKGQWFKTSIWVTAFSSVFIAIGIADFFSRIYDEYKILSVIKTIYRVTIVLILVVLFKSEVFPVGKIQGRYRIGDYTKNDLSLMHEWIEKNIPKDAVVLCPPEDDSFSCEAKRSAPSGYKAIIHEPFFMIPWYEKFCSLYGVSLETSGNSDVLKVASSLYAIRHYRPLPGSARIDYRLDDVIACKFKNELGEEIHREGRWLLTKIVPSTP